MRIQQKTGRQPGPVRKWKLEEMKRVVSLVGVIVLIVDLAVLIRRHALHQQQAHSSAVEATSSALWRQGRWLSALRELKTGLALNPRSQTLHLVYARRLMEMGRFRDAAAEYQQWAPPPAQHPFCALRWAHCLQNSERYEAAEQVLQKLHPNIATLHLAEVRLLRATTVTDPRLHRQLTDSALGLLTGDDEYQRSIRAAIMLERHRPRTALQEMDPARPPTFNILSTWGSLQDLNEIAQFQTVLATIYMQLGQLNRAEALMAKLLKQIHTGVGRAFEQDKTSAPLGSLVAPFLLTTDDRVPVLDTFSELMGVLIIGSVLNHQPLPEKDMSLWVDRINLLRRDGILLPASEQALVQSLGGLLQALDTRNDRTAMKQVDRMSAALSHRGADCAPWSLVNQETTLGALQILGGDLALAVHDTTEARRRYGRAMQQPSVVLLARQRLLRMGTP